MSNYIIDATWANFEDAVLRNSHKELVMVNYWAECRALFTPVAGIRKISERL